MSALSITSNAIDNISLALLWDPGEDDMDDGDNPNKANFSLLVDGVPRAIGNVWWNGANNLQIAAAGAAAATSFQITQDALDYDVVNLNGVVAVPGQSKSVLVP